MKTPEEIKKGLSVCSNADAVNEPGECEGCPYLIEGQILCGINTMMKDSIDYIEQLEERINLMLIQMRGDCGCCAYKGRPSYKSPCTECLCGENRPMWEYEGLPELTKEESNA